VFVKRTQELDHHAARILEEISRDEAITQRKLSERVGIALAVTNSYVGRLVRKGHLKARTLPRNRLKYFVTPSGLALKARLTYEYVTGSLRFYQEARTRLKAALDRLEQEGVRRVAFLGAGDLAEIAYLTIQESGLEFAGIFDDAKAGEIFFGHKVLPESGLANSGAERLLYTRQNWSTDLSYAGHLPVVNLFGESP